MMGGGWPFKIHWKYSDWQNDTEVCEGIAEVFKPNSLCIPLARHCCLTLATWARIYDLISVWSVKCAYVYFAGCPYDVCGQLPLQVRAVTGIKHKEKYIYDTKSYKT